MAATTVDNRHLHLNSLPLIDVRLLSHSELLSLSLCSSSTVQYDDEHHDSTPKIDASVFNESAGSRKQTFSRLRLAPRNSSPLPPRIPPPAPVKPVDEENSQVTLLLKSLLNIQSHSSPVIADEDDANQLVSVRVEFEDFWNTSGNGYVGLQNIPVELITCSQTKRKRGRPRKDQSVSSASDHRWLIASDNGEIDKTMVTVMDGSSQNTPVGKRKPGRPRKNDGGIAKVNETGDEIDKTKMVVGSDVVTCETRKRKPGRPRKNESMRGYGGVNSDNGLVLSESGDAKMEIMSAGQHEDVKETAMENKDGRETAMENKDGRETAMEDKDGKETPMENRDGKETTMEDRDGKETTMENRDGSVVNVVPSANAEDPFWEELRRTQGTDKGDELLDFWKGSNGEW